jgi:hypothetical protein
MEHSRPFPEQELAFADRNHVDDFIINVSDLEDLDEEDARDADYSEDGVDGDGALDLKDQDSYDDDDDDREPNFENPMINRSLPTHHRNHYLHPEMIYSSNSNIQVLSVIVILSLSLGFIGIRDFPIQPNGAMVSVVYVGQLRTGLMPDVFESQKLLTDMLSRYTDSAENVHFYICLDTGDAVDRMNVKLASLGGYIGSAKVHLVLQHNVTNGKLPGVTRMQFCYSQIERYANCRNYNYDFVIKTRPDFYWVDVAPDLRRLRRDTAYSRARVAYGFDGGMDMRSLSIWDLLDLCEGNNTCRWSDTEELQPNAQCIVMDDQVSDNTALQFAFSTRQIVGNLHIILYSLIDWWFIF